MNKADLDKFVRGNWVFVPRKPIDPSEIRKYMSVDKYNTYFRLCSGRVLRILAFDKGAKMVHIRITNTHSMWLRMEWVVPLDKSEAKRVKYENECLAEVNRQTAVVNKKRDEMMGEIFQSEGIKKLKKEEREKKKAKQRAANRITAPFRFNYLDEGWFQD